MVDTNVYIDLLRSKRDAIHVLYRWAVTETSRSAAWSAWRSCAG